MSSSTNTYLAVPRQLNRWPCDSLTDDFTFLKNTTIEHSKKQFLMTIFGDNFRWQFLMKIFNDNFYDNFWWHVLMTIFRFLKTIHIFGTIFRFFDFFLDFRNFFNIFGKNIRFSENLLTWHLTLETLINDHIADDWEQQYQQFLCDLWIKSDGESDVF